MRVLCFAVMFLFLFAVPVLALDTDRDRYSDTVNAVFDRLEGKIVPENSPEPGGKDFSDEKSERNESKNEENTNNVPKNDNLHEEFKIKPIPKTFEGSILERMQRENTISLSGAEKKLDAAVTAIHHSVSSWLIEIAPVVLIIGALLAMFARGRAAGFLFLFGIMLFVVLFAPEITQAVISIIMGTIK